MIKKLFNFLLLIIMFFTWTSNSFSLTQVYNISSGNLVNLPNNCGSAYYTNGSGLFGFRWTDVLPAGSVVSSITVQFNVTYELSPGSKQTYLNSNAGSSVSSVTDFSCPGGDQLFSVNPSTAYYNVSADNVFEINTASFTGLNTNFATLGGYYAKVTVTYTAGPTPDIALSNNGSQISVSNVSPGMKDVVLHKSALRFSTGSANLTGMTCVLAGNYGSSDISNLKVRYSTDETLDAADATLSTIASPGTAGSKTFASFTSQPIWVNTTGYIFITCDISSAASLTKYVSVDALTTGNFTFTGGNKTGSTSAGGSQTFASPTIVIANNGTQISAAGVAPGTVNHVLHKAAITPSNSGCNLTGMTCVTGGNYVSADLSKLKVWYSTNNTFESASDVLLSTINSPGTAGTKTFSSFTSQGISQNTTGYIFITCDISSGGSLTKTINISGLATTNFTFTTGSVSGSTTSAGNQTITTPSVVLANNGSQVAAANISQGTENLVLHKFQLSATSAGATLTGAQCALAGTYVAADVANLKLWYSSDASFSSSSDVLLGTETNPGTSGTKTFSSLTSQSIEVNTTGYFFITIGVSASAGVNRTINCNAVTTAHLTYYSASESGSTTNGGSQTFKTPSITLANNGTQVSNANVVVGSTNFVLHKSQLTVSATCNAYLTGMQCVTAGTYVSADLTNLKVWYSSDNSFDAGSDELLSTYTSPGAGGTKTFPSFIAKNIDASTTGYIFITADISISATSGNTINVNALTTAHITFAAGSKSGSTTNGGSQTIVVPSITLANNGSQVGTANVTQGTTNHILHRTSLAVSANGAATLTGMQCVTTGTYIATDIENIKVWYSADNSFDSSFDALLSTYIAPGTAGTKSFPSFISQQINASTTGYIFITADIFPGATVARTVGVNALSTGDLTFQAGNKSGSSTNGGAQTITGTTYSNIYKVNSTASSGVGTLNQAITDANASAGKDYIYFDLGTDPYYTITLTGALPTLTDNSGVVIDGFCNLGNHGVPNAVSLANISPSTPMSTTHRVVLTSAATNKGIVINSNNNTIRGLVLETFDDASMDNTNNAVYIQGGTSNKVIGCFIGMQRDGVTKGGTKLAAGVWIESNSNQIGDGTAAGANLISGAYTGAAAGVYISGANVNGNNIQGNIIGLQKDGKSIVSGANQVKGVGIASTGSPYNNTIGGTTSGQGNVISGNTNSGISLNSASVTGNNVYGNIIGIAADGVTNVTNNTQAHGIYIADSPNNNIGGNTAGHRNIISGNRNPAAGGASTGILLQGPSTYGNKIKGNYIGLDKTGTTYITGHEQDNGIMNTNGTVPGANTIGGTAAGEGNVLSGNNTAGAWLLDGGPYTYQGNIIGLQANGESLVVSNSQDNGLYISDNFHVIGGTVAGARNIISGNVNNGIYLYSGGDNTSIYGNYIGPTASLANPGGTQTYGVYAFLGANNSIGGTSSSYANIIAYNTSYGVYVADASAIGNKILGNSIHSNSDIPIKLSSGNNLKATPAVTSINHNNASGTAGAGDRIEIFKNTTDDPKDATIYLGYATADGSGNWTYSFGRGMGRALLDTEWVMFNATDASNNTSEFTDRRSPLPIELMEFNANCTGKEVNVEWTTASETNNDYFTIERSIDGVNNEVIGIVKGSGTTTSQKSYTFIDEKPLDGISYYRLKQTDFDGKYEYFKLVSVSCVDDISFSDINVYPNPSAGNYFNISVPTSLDTEVVVIVYDVNGRETYSKVLLSESEDKTVFAIDLEEKLSPGIYVIVASSSRNVYKKRLIVK